MARFETFDELLNFVRTSGNSEFDYQEVDCDDGYPENGFTDLLGALRENNNLTHIKLGGFHSDSYYMDVQKMAITELLNANPQIQSLNFECTYLRGNESSRLWVENSLNEANNERTILLKFNDESNRIDWDDEFSGPSIIGRWVNGVPAHNISDEEENSDISSVASSHTEIRFAMQTTENSLDATLPTYSQGSEDVFQNQQESQVSSPPLYDNSSIINQFERERTKRSRQEDRAIEAEASSSSDVKRQCRR